MQVQYNFTGEGGDSERSTDISWTTDGDTTWNWRFKLPVKLPCKIPRIKFKMWDAGLLTGDQFIGEVSFNFAKFFKETFESRRPKNVMHKQTLNFVHSNFMEEKLGSIHFEASILMQSEADVDPVGEAQNEPNKNPYLAPPQRNPPPYQVLSGGLYFLLMLSRLKYVIFGLLFLCIAGPLIIPIVLASVA